MKLPQALSMAATHKLTVLLPTKMGFSLIVRSTKGPYSKPSINAELMNKYQIDGFDMFECNVIEVNLKGRKVIKEVQQKWLQLAITESDINNPHYLVM